MSSWKLVYCHMECIHKLESLFTVRIEPRSLLLLLPRILKILAEMKLCGWIRMDSVTADTKFIRTLKNMDLELLKNTLAGTAETKSFTWLNTLTLTNQINLQNIHTCIWLPGSQVLSSTGNPKRYEFKTTSYVLKENMNQ